MIQIKNLTLASLWPSGVGLKAFPNQPAYVAGKHGVVGLTKTAALEFATAGIRVNAIGPGATLTPMVETKARAGVCTIEGVAAMWPMKRIADPDEIAPDRPLTTRSGRPTR